MDIEKANFKDVQKFPNILAHSISIDCFMVRLTKLKTCCEIINDNVRLDLFVFYSNHHLIMFKERNVGPSRLLPSFFSVCPILHCISDSDDNFRANDEHIQ